MTMHEVRIIAFNRPEHTAACVDALLANDRSGWRIVASVDALPDGSHNEAVVRECRRATGDVRLRPRLGLNNHMHKNWSEVATGDAEWFLHLEDDILLADDALRFCRDNASWLLSAELPHGSLHSLCLLGDQLHDVEEAQRKWPRTQERDFFCAYGAFLSRVAVRLAVMDWCFGWASWDCGLTDLYHTRHWHHLAPIVSRSRNIGYAPDSRLGREVARPVWSNTVLSAQSG